MAKNKREIKAFREWLLNADNDERERVSKAVGAKVIYFWHIAGGHSKASPVLAKRLSEETGISPSEFRPDVFDSEAA